MVIVVQVPGVKISKSARFNVYEKDGRNIIEGDAGNIGYEGEELPERYCLAIRDPATKRVKLVDASLMCMNSFIKAKRKAHAATQPTPTSYVEMRSALGQTFGTRRTKQELLDEERNKVDAEQFGEMEVSIVDEMKTAYANVPERQERQKVSKAIGLIPDFNPDAEKPAEIYPISDIVTETELKTIPTGVLERAATEEKRSEILIYGKSNFVNDHITSVLREGVNVVPRLRLLVYLDYLFAFYHCRRQAVNRLKLHDLLPSVSEEVVSGIIDRFTVNRTGSRGQVRADSFTVDSPHVDKLLSYILLLTLHVNKFQVDIVPLCHDLSLQTTRVTALFANIGCSIRQATAPELRQRNILGHSAYRIAQLKLPLRFPKPKGVRKVG